MVLSKSTMTRFGVSVLMMFLSDGACGLGMKSIVKY